MFYQVPFLDIQQFKEVKMKISVDDLELFRLSETQKKVIKNDIDEDIFDEDMKRRLHYILTHKYERCFKRLKEEWVDTIDEKGKNKLANNGVHSIPTDRDALSELIISQKNYKNKKSRESEAKINNI